MTIRNVTVLGADGKLGPAILDALLQHGFIVTVLKRSSSGSPDNYPASVKVARAPDDFPVGALVPILQGQDAVIATIKGSQIDLQSRVADAAVKAGVKRFIPADFGSCDSASPLTQELVPLYKRKTEFRNYLEKLAKESNGAFTWTALVPGHFFDWELQFIHIFLDEKRADILDDGNKKFSISTLGRIGEATARVLTHPQETQNKILYVQSFCVTQNEVVRAFEKATGSKWEVRSFESGKWRDDHKKKADQGDLDAVEELVWYLGTVDANWQDRDTFAMGMLELEDQRLDEVVSKIVKDAK